MGWGIGGNVLLPVIPKYLDLQGSVLTGQGIGRYGSSQLPDVQVGPTGAFKTIQATHFLVGAVAHPWVGNDFYAYYGQEQNAPTPGLANGATQGGLGNSAYTNNQCAVELGAAAASGTGSGAFNQAGAGPPARLAHSMSRRSKNSRLASGRMLTKVISDGSALACSMNTSD